MDRKELLEKASGILQDQMALFLGQVQANQGKLFDLNDWSPEFLISEFLQARGQELAEEVLEWDEE